MANQAKRRKHFEENFELADEQGRVVKTLAVKQDADDIVGKVHRKYTALTKALSDTADLQRKAAEGQEAAEAIEILGEAVVSLMEAVFGPEDTKTITEFYEGRYIEMTQEVLPFITKVVIPRCMEIKKENQKRILQSYDRKSPNKGFKRER